MKTLLKEYWNLLISYLKPQRLWVLVLAALLLSNISLQLINPQIMRHFIDVATRTAQSGSTSGTLSRIALLFIGIALLQQVIGVLATYIGENVGWTATNALRADLADHCVRLDMSFHNARTPGEMIERIDGDVNALANFFSQFVIQVLGNTLLLIGVLALLFREDARVGLVFIGFSLVNMLSMWQLRDIAVPHLMAERQSRADLFGFLEERLAGTEDIRSCGAKAYVMRRSYQLMRDLMKKSLKAGWIINIMVNIMWMLVALGSAIALAIGAYLFQRQSITIGTVYLIFHYSTMLTPPIRRIARQLQDLQQAGAGIARIRALLNTQSKIREFGDSGAPRLGVSTYGRDDGGSEESLPATVALPNGALAIEFRNISFGYETSQPTKEMVLHDLSFRLQPGKVLGLLGRTGSGKTTLTRLLFRLYDPDVGGIYLGHDGADLADVRQVPLAHLRQRVGLVTQSVQLFHATVRDNLVFFDRGVSDEQILNVIQELELEEWYQSLPQGLDTVIESGGGGLSAGEAQLLAFTRIFLKEPGLVILDEASSRLDPATECLIERAVDKLLHDRTAIVIAHRLQTVRRADEIILLEDGHICEHGERATLASDPTSRFYSLLQTGLEEVLV